MRLGVYRGFRRPTLKVWADQETHLRGHPRLPLEVARTSTDPSSSTSRSSALPGSRSSPRRSAWTTTRPPYAVARHLHRGLSRQALILVLLIALAFGTAIYMGVRNPYESPAAEPVPEPLRMTVIPLAPQGAVPGAIDTEQLFAHSPAAEFRIGAEGITLPATRRTAHFSDSQVVSALTTAKDYIVESSLDPEVLTGREVRAVRVMLDPDQLDQFDRASTTRPPTAGTRPPAGWCASTPPAPQLADGRIRVRGTLRAAETDSATLEVVADHTFVYALRPTGADGRTKASLFTVRRELHFRFDRDDLRMHQVRAGRLLRPGRTAVLRGGLRRLPEAAAGRRDGQAGRPRGYRSVRHGWRDGAVRVAGGGGAAEGVRVAAVVRRVRAR